MHDGSTACVVLEPGYCVVLRRFAPAIALAEIVGSVRFFHELTSAKVALDRLNTVVCEASSGGKEE